MTLPESPGAAETARDKAKKALAVEFWMRLDTGSNELDKEIAANQAELMIQALTDAGLAIIDRGVARQTIRQFIIDAFNVDHDPGEPDDAGSLADDLFVALAGNQP